MAALPVRPPRAHGLPSYREWITRTFARMRRDHRPDSAMEALMAAAQELYAEISSDAGEPMLLHGDLHHDNILRSGDGRWKVIDPQGVIGAPFLECGRFLQNHVLWDEGDPDPGTVAGAVAFVADRLGRSQRRIASALFVIHLLSVCWSLEMDCEPDGLRAQTLQCSSLLELARRI